MSSAPMNRLFPAPMPCASAPEFRGVSEEPMFLAERLAAGDPDPEALAWLAHGLRR